MIPINNSDTAWLIVSDYNQDNDISFPEALRKDILNPEINCWVWEDDLHMAEDVGYMSVIGGMGNHMGDIENICPGFRYPFGYLIGDNLVGHFVGGHEPDPNY